MQGLRVGPNLVAKKFSAFSVGRYWHGNSNFSSQKIFAKTRLNVQLDFFNFRNWFNNTDFRSKLGPIIPKPVGPIRARLSSKT